MTAGSENFFSNYLQTLNMELSNLKPELFAEAAMIINNTRFNDNTIFIGGNGGSAATASHFACDLLNLNYKHIKDDHLFEVSCLTDNIASLTAISNDFSYSDTLILPLVKKIKQNDILILITASGNSENIIRAAEYAKSAGAFIMGFIGFGGGKLLPLCNFSICTNEKNYGTAEDIHLITEHMITNYISEVLLKK